MVRKYVLGVFLVICGLLAKTHGNSELHEIVTNFARKLFRAVISKSGHDNVIISPYAIQRILMVALQAARGTLYANMQGALEIECVGDVLADGLFKSYPPGFRYVDQIFHTVNTTLRIPYILIAKILFNVLPETIDLSNKRAVAKQINSFIQKGSTGIITNYLNSTEIDNESSIYFINAVYFEGHWETPFIKNNDRSGKFLNNGNTEIQVQHLYSVQYVNYGRLPDVYDASIIELPYKNADEKMLIVLPKNRMDLNRVQLKIMGLDFPLILRRMKQTLVSISLPYFSIEYRTDLSKIATELGFNGLFDPEADLSNGFDIAPPTMAPRLFQKAFFELNHYGSVVDMPRSNRKNPAPEPFENEVRSPDKFFVVERPFLFFLHTNGTIHFIGSVQSISQTSSF